jgi:predicted dehydrogenase
MGISLGLVGLGSFGSSMAELFKSHPLVERIALCDREPERTRKFAERESFQDKLDPSDVYDSLDEILKTDIEALAIVTQPWLHAPQAVKAMKSGKHVYSAVPVMSVPDGDEILEWCDRIVKTCEGTGCRYMLGETTYYRPQTMYCRRRADAGDFGDFVYAEGEYFHDVDSPSCSLREVQRHRHESKAGREWTEESKAYEERGILYGPMHYPTHSTSGPVSVMKAHATKVSALAYFNKHDDPYFGKSPSNETALFRMSNEAHVRICEYREISLPGREIFRVYGNRGSFENDSWCDKEGAERLSVDQMRDPLPDDVYQAFHDANPRDVYGGHGGSHAYLVNEFVQSVNSDRQPATNAWEAVRYMAMGVMAHKSALMGGKVLKVPDWGDAPDER